MADSITPPPELVQLWMSEDAPWDSDSFGILTCRPSQLRHIAARAAQWGADQQLAEDAEWLDHNALNDVHLGIIPMGESLKEAMRPKPPTRKERALKSLDGLALPDDAFETIRFALEALDD